MKRPMSLLRWLAVNAPLPCAQSSLSRILVHLLECVDLSDETHEPISATKRVHGISPP